MIKTQPNVVIYCTDEMRADYMGCTGNPLVKTPNIDKLAERGTIFENMYVQGTVCMPSRASIITGTYPSRHGVTDNGIDLSPHCTTIGGVMRDAGYHTMAVGRTHFIVTQGGHTYPQENFYGFNEACHAQSNYPSDHGNEYFNYIYSEHNEYYKDISNDKHEFVETVTTPEELSFNAWVTQKSLERIENHLSKNNDQPFMLWAGVWDPHPPFRAQQEWGKLYNPKDMPERVKNDAEVTEFPSIIKEYMRSESDADWKVMTAKYMAMVSHLDYQFGKLLDGLDKMGELDNTIIIFTSDHGEMLGAHHCMGKGVYFYDDALKVPCVVAGPGIPTSKSLVQLTETIDIMPSLLELTSVDIPLEVQGKSFVPLLNGNVDKLHDNVFTEYQHHFNDAGKPVDEKINEYIFSIFDGHYRIVCFCNREYGQLFNIKEDPDCLENLWNNREHEIIKNDLLNKLMHRMAQNLIRPDTRLSNW